MGKNLKKKIEIIRRNYPLLRKEYNVKRLGVFGSYARGEETRASDIDMLVEFYEPIGMFKFMRLERNLGKMLGKKTDLVTKQALKPALKKKILKDVIYV